MIRNKIKSIAQIVIIAAIIICIVLLINELNFNKDINNNEENKILKDGIIANKTTAFLMSGDNGKNNFLNIARNKEVKLNTGNTDNCVNITPNFVSQNSDYQIFKFNDTASTYLLYEDEIYELGKSKESYGVISFALADMDKDNEYELYYTYSWKSGMFRTNVGYFNPASKEIKNFNKSYKDEEIILITDETNLYLYDAEFTNYIDVTNFRMQAGKVVGEIVVENNNLVIKEVN